MLGITWDNPEMLDCFGRCRARFSHGAVCWTSTTRMIWKWT